MADAITPRCGGGATPPMPHLDDGVASEILCRLPTKDAYRLAAVCPRWRAALSQPTFLCRHLSPHPLPLLDDHPYALIVQPLRKVGFTHLTLVGVDPADRVPVNVPVQPKYADPASPPRHLLCSTGADDLFPAPDAAHDDDGAESLAAAAPDLPAADGVVSSDPATTTIDVPAVDAVPVDPTPALPLVVQVQVEDYIVFFERTVPMLGISIVASYGRLLLGRSQSRYYVCDPAANRWLALPPSTIAPVSVTNSALHYDASTGRLAFTVVLLVRRRRQRVLVETFRSATGRWDARELAARGAARCLGAASPGIHAGTCFYWLSRRRGRILCYDALHGRASVLREPPEAVQSKGRVGRSLGSVGGRLRLCAFDVRDEESDSMLPHDDVEGVHGVWVMGDGPATAAEVRPPWRRVHEAVVGDMWTYYFNMLLNHETPVDFAGACGEFIVVDKFDRLLRYDLESGSKVELANLEFRNRRLRALYNRYHVFPFFK